MHLHVLYFYAFLAQHYFEICSNNSVGMWDNAWSMYPTLPSGYHLKYKGKGL